MRRIIVNCVAAAAVLFFAPFLSQAADAPPAPRLALLTQGAPDPQLQQILDLLFASLARRADLALVERSAIDAIFKEHTLSLAAGADGKPEDLLACCKLLSADGLLLLGMERKSGADPVLRVRLLDARLGLKLLEGLVPAGERAADLARAADAVTDCVGRHAGRLSAPLKDLRVIGVSAFRSQELSTRWNWLAEAIPSGIERNLALYDDVILAERREVTPLLSEREIAPSLDSALLSATWHVVGSFRVDEQHHRLLISFKAKKEAGAPLEFQVDGDLDELEVLCRKIAQRLADAAQSSSAKSARDPRAEARFLADEARAYMKLKEPESAVAPAEGAYALMPEDVTYQCLFIDALTRGKLMLSPRRRAYPSDAESALLRVFNLLERLLRAERRADRSTKATGPDYCTTIDQAMQRARAFLSPDKGGALIRRGRVVPSVDLRPFVTSSTESYSFCDYAGCVERYWALSLLLMTTRDDQNREPFVRAFYHANSAVRLMTDPDRAAQRVKELLVLGQKLRPGVDVYAFDTLNSVRCNFKDNQKVIRELEAFNASLLYSRSANVRYQAAISGMDMAFSPSSVRLYANAFVTLCLEQNRPDLEELCSRTYSADREESARIEADYLMTFITSFLSPPSRQKALGPQLSEGWSRGTLRLADILERSGRKREAAEWVSKVMSAEADVRSVSSHSAAWVTLSERLDKLSGKEPESGPPSAVTPANTYQAKVLFTSDAPAVRADIMSSTSFEQLLLSPSGPLIVYYSAAERGYGKMTCGLIGLDSFSNNVSKIRSYSFQNGKDGKRFPPCFRLSGAMYGSDVYVGHPEHGILIFRADGSVTLLNESSGLAYSHVRNLERLGDKLYAIVGTYEAESGLMEIDINTHSSRMLASTKSEDSRIPISGLRINGLAADTVHNKLWLLCTNTGLPSQRQKRVFCYTPRTGAYSQVEDPSLAEFLPKIPAWDEVRFLRACGESLVFQGAGGFMQYNLRNSRGNVWPNPVGGIKLPDSCKYFYRTILTKEGSVSAAGPFLVFLRNGVSDPILIPTTVIPSPHCNSVEVKDFAVTEQGLYVLTRELLCLLPTSSLTGWIH